jgi:effector-binding domain-containing protein
MVETVKYEVNRKIGRVEIRRYPKIVVAKVENSEVDGFDLLYKFITGNNRQKTKVKMTTPVVSQQIAMTSPVLSDTGSIAFVMPAEYTIETTPEPADSHVRITEVPSKFVAALRFSGGWSEDLFEKKKEELISELSRAGIKTRGKVFTMLYNPPFIPGFLRRNEIAIEIEEP